MPTYDFECPNKHIFEEIVKLSDPVPDECPECKAPGDKCTRVWAAGGTNLIGSVNPTGREEIRADIARGARALQRKSDKSESFTANVIGEKKYNRMVGGK